MITLHYIKNSNKIVEIDFAGPLEA